MFKYDESLNVTYIPSYYPTGKYEGIRALTYDGPETNGKKTKVFAYMGVPDGYDMDRNYEHKIPAMVLVHGGCGYAFLDWVKQWNDRGYAAISICNVGLFPVRRNAGDREGAIFEDWTHELCGVFAQEDYTVPPTYDDMQLSECQSIDSMWMYHAVAQVIRAYDVIAMLGCVDDKKVGLTGISWGSVVTSIALGYENSYAFAIPVYGSGYLEEALTFMRFKFNVPMTRKMWLAQDRFKNINIPVLWLCLNDDFAFSINCNSKSFADTCENNPLTQLSIKSNWVHGHSCCWDTSEYECHEIFKYADAMTGDKKGFMYITHQEYTKDAGQRDRLSVIFTGENNSNTLYTATLYYQDEYEYEYTIPADIHKSYLAHKWKTAEVTITPKGDNCFAAASVLPQNTTYCYMEIAARTDNIKYVVSSKFYC